MNVGAASDRARVLQLLTAQPDDATLSIGDLRDGGVWHPAQAIYELVLAGYPVQRVGGHGYRLRQDP